MTIGGRSTGGGLYRQVDHIKNAEVLLDTFNKWSFYTGGL